MRKKAYAYVVDEEDLTGSWGALSEEDTWAFGKVVSLVLLALPLINFSASEPLFPPVLEYLADGFTEAYYASPPASDTLRMKGQSESTSCTPTLGRDRIPADPANDLPRDNSRSSPTAPHGPREVTEEPWYNVLLASCYAISSMVAASGLYIFAWSDGAELWLSSQTNYWTGARNTGYFGMDTFRRGNSVDTDTDFH